MPRNKSEKECKVLAVRPRDLKAEDLKARLKAAARRSSDSTLDLAKSISLGLGASLYARGALGFVNPGAGKGDEDKEDRKMRDFGLIAMVASLYMSRGKGDGPSLGDLKAMWSEGDPLLADPPGAPGEKKGDAKEPK